MSSKCPSSPCTHDLRRSCHWSITASITFCSESTHVCVKRFCRSQMPQSLFRICSAAQHPKCYNLHVHFVESYTIHLMQFSFIISHCNITFSLFWISQGTVATLIRWGGWNSYPHMYRSSLNLTVKIALKYVDFSRCYTQKIRWLLFMVHCVYGTRKQSWICFL